VRVLHLKKVLYLSLFLLAALVFSIPAHASGLSYKNGDMLKSDTTWEGRVTVDGVVFVPEGVTLTIKPGTTVLFKKSGTSYSEEGEDEVIIPGSGIRVEGKVLAVGEKGKEIAFTSAEQSPAPGDWGCIFMDHSKGSVFTRCRFEYSAYTLHAHFSSFDVSRCIITHNEDGSRLGICRTIFDHCDILDNTGKGLNFRQCRNTVTRCNITGNQDGIFLNEKDTACVIEGNNIYGNKGMDLRLGEFHAEDVTLVGNYWGTADIGDIKKHVYDRDDDPAIGAAHIEPAEEKIIGAGVDGMDVKVLWKFKTGGFVDCSPASEKGVVYFGSWDKNFYAVKQDTGELVWKFATGDCVDSSPAIAYGKVYFGSWDRNIYCLDIKDGKLVWKFTMPPSNFDDHRQASPEICEKEQGVPDQVFMGGFNGAVYAFDLETGRKIWEFQTGGSVRSKPAISLTTPGCGYIGSADGALYSLNYKTGEIIWKAVTGGAVNSSSTRAKFGIYFGSRDGSLYCYDDISRKKIWSYDTHARIEYSSPLIAGSLVYIGDCNGVLHAVDKDTGKGVWTFRGEGGIYSSPRLAGGKVVYSDNSGMVYWLVPETGAPLSNFRAGDAVQGLSAGENGVVYAGSRDGYLYALTLGE
jgi:parallel beta-helix repeat protein